MPKIVAIIKAVDEDRAVARILTRFNAVTAGTRWSDLDRFQCLRHALEDEADSLRSIGDRGRSVVSEALNKAVSGLSGQYNGDARHDVSKSVVWCGLLEDSDVQRIVDRFASVSEGETDVVKTHRFVKVIMQEAEALERLNGKKEERMRVAIALQSAFEQVPEGGGYRDQHALFAIEERKPVWKEYLSFAGRVSIKVYLQTKCRITRKWN